MTVYDIFRDVINSNKLVLNHQARWDVYTCGNNNMRLILTISN